MWYSLYKIQTLYFSPSASFSLSFRIPHCCSLYGGDGGLWFLENILRKPLGRFYHVKLGNYKHLIVEERSEAPGCIEILQIGVWSRARGGWTWNIEHTIFGYKPYNQQRVGGGGLTENMLNISPQARGNILASIRKIKNFMLYSECLFGKDKNICLSSFWIFISNVVNIFCLVSIFGAIKILGSIARTKTWTPGLWRNVPARHTEFCTFLGKIFINIGEDARNL